MPVDQSSTLSSSSGVDFVFQVTKCFLVLEKNYMVLKKEWQLKRQDTGFLFRGEENVLKIMVMVAQFVNILENHYAVHFKWMNFISQQSC